jgi:hypothetical protein
VRKKRGNESKVKKQAAIQKLTKIIEEEDNEGQAPVQASYNKDLLNATAASRTLLINTN